tara:strand:- start:3817 stop:5793 length:1977 start_codon:yes stop_codon:yes gene_type:complete
MRSLNLILNDAEHDWREDVNRHFPLRSDTPVIKKSKANGRDWSFSTDLKNIFATISNDENLQRKFETEVSKYWDGDPEEIAKAVLHYLLHHELYHPIEAPFSVKGEDNDNKQIHQAIRRGLLQAEPSLSPMEQVVKVQVSQNGVKDFILDNRFALDNESNDYVRNDVIPIWDFIELLNTPSKTNFYTITRILYGAMYGPQSINEFFEKKSGKKGVDVAEKALSILIGKEVQLPRKKTASLVDKAKSLLDNDQNQEIYEQIKEYIKEIRTVFSGVDRYKGIELFMSVLGPYVEKGMPQARPDMQGQGSGGTPQNILQDLLDDMTPEEQAQFIEGLSQEDLEELGQGSDDDQSNSVTSDEKTDQEFNTLDVFALHEFYKRNHPIVKIIGGSKTGQKVTVGKQEYWDLKKSSILTEDQLSKINLRKINLLQKRTKLPWLIDLGNGTYRLDEYELKQHNIKDIIYVDEQLDVPDIVEFYLDSSGSMFSNQGNFGFNDGSRWDMLANVLYGYIDALYQAGKVIGKQSKIRIHNFADSQKDSELVSVDEFLRGDTNVLKVLFKPKNGYSVEDIDIDEKSDNLKRSYVVVTDGDLVIDGRTDRESQKMIRLAQNPKNHVMLFEIEKKYSLGRAVENNLNIVYKPVHDKNEMLQAGIEVLLSKWCT